MVREGLWGVCLDSYLTRSEFQRKVGERAGSLRKLSEENNPLLGFLKCGTVWVPPPPPVVCNLDRKEETRCGVRSGQWEGLSVCVGET